MSRTQETRILALWNPRMKYVVTSRVALVLPLTSALPPPSDVLWVLKKDSKIVVYYESRKEELKIRPI